MKADHTPRAGGARIAGEIKLRHRFFSHRWLSTSTARRPPSRDEWGFARVARRSPGLAVWCVVLMLAGTRAWTRDPFPESLERDRALRDAQHAATARSFVYESLDVIGHRVRVNGVEAKPLHCGAYGVYHLDTRTISINLLSWWNEEDVLSTAAHESVHALFHRITREDDVQSLRLFHQLIHETSASVLGAYVAGRVWEQRGHDGEALTRRLISEYRDSCDPTKPDSLYQAIARRQAEDGPYAFSPGVELNMHIHFGSTALVDEIDAICRSSPDAWTAAHRIAERYLKRGAKSEPASRAGQASSPRRERLARGMALPEGGQR